MTEPTQTTAGTIRLGRISGVFGVKGWVKLISYTEPREAILDYRRCQLYAEGQARTLSWAEGRRQGKLVIARLEGVTDRDTAEGLIGSEIVIRREDLPDLGGESYYWADLEGLTIIDGEGRRLGQVDHLLATGANDVLVVKGEAEMLIPFVLGQTVVNVDLAAGVIQVDWEWE